MRVARVREETSSDSDSSESNEGRLTIVEESASATSMSASATPMSASATSMSVSTPTEGGRNRDNVDWSVKKFNSPTTSGHMTTSLSAPPPRSESKKTDRSPGDGKFSNNSSHGGRKAEFAPPVEEWFPKRPINPLEEMQRAAASHSHGLFNPAYNPALLGSANMKLFGTFAAATAESYEAMDVPSVTMVVTPKKKGRPAGSKDTTVRKKKNNTSVDGSDYFDGNDVKRVSSAEDAERESSKVHHRGRPAGSKNRPKKSTDDSMSSSSSDKREYSNVGEHFGGFRDAMAVGDNQDNVRNFPPVFEREIAHMSSMSDVRRIGQGDRAGGNGKHREYMNRMGEGGVVGAGGIHSMMGRPDFGVPFGGGSAMLTGCITDLDRFAGPNQPVSAPKNMPVSRDTVGRPKERPHMKTSSEHSTGGSRGGMFTPSNWRPIPLVSSPLDAPPPMMGMSKSAVPKFGGPPPPAHVESRSLFTPHGLPLPPRFAAPPQFLPPGSSGSYRVPASQKETMSSGAGGAYREPGHKGPHTQQDGPMFDNSDDEFPDLVIDVPT